MNSVFKLSLAGVIALALSACGGQQEAAKPTPETTPASGTAPVVEKRKFVLVRLLVILATWYATKFNPCWRKKAIK